MLTSFWCLVVFFFMSLDLPPFRAFYWRNRTNRENPDGSGLQHNRCVFGPGQRLGVLANAMLRDTTRTHLQAYLPHSPSVSSLPFFARYPGASLSLSAQYDIMTQHRLPACNLLSSVLCASILDFRGCLSSSDDPCSLSSVLLWWGVCVFVG